MRLEIPDIMDVSGVCLLEFRTVLATLSQIYRNFIDHFHRIGVVYKATEKNCIEAIALAYTG